jgi:hypothetical protein
MACEAPRSRAAAREDIDFMMDYLMASAFGSIKRSECVDGDGPT